MSSSSSINSSSSASSTSEARDTQEDAVRCSVCGRQFDDMAEMQRHVLTEHMQKGDLPNEEH
jgi:uncharacterized C2H2 Zn-finger protein